MNYFSLPLSPPVIFFFFPCISLSCLWRTCLVVDFWLVTPGMTTPIVEILKHPQRVGKERSCSSGQMEHLLAWPSSGHRRQRPSPAGLLPDESLCLPLWWLSLLTLSAMDNLVHNGVKTAVSSPHCWAFRPDAPAAWRTQREERVHPPSSLLLAASLVRAKGVCVGEMGQGTGHGWHGTGTLGCLTLLPQVTPSSCSRPGTTFLLSGLNRPSALWGPFSNCLH